MLLPVYSYSCSVWYVNFIEFVVTEVTLKICQLVKTCTCVSGHLALVSTCVTFLPWHEDNDDNLNVLCIATKLHPWLSHPFGTRSGIPLLQRL